MTADLSASTYLVNGVDLEATGVQLTHDGAGLWAGLAENVGISTAPGFNGGTVDGGTFPPYTLSTMFAIHAAGYDATWAAIRALRRRCLPGQSVTLTRQMPDPEGGASNTNQTTTARRITDRVEWLNTHRDALVDIDWAIVDGAWYGAAVTVASVAGTYAINGDLGTQRMTVTLAAGAARTVANTTNGYTFTFSTTVPTGGVLVDVEARTATAITGGADMSRYLSWAKAHPLRLEAGSNVLTVSAGTASLSYQPAYQ